MGCFLPIEGGVIYAFVVPAMFIILINTVVLIKTLHIFLDLKTNKDKSEVERIKATLRAMFILTPLLGLTWIFGLLQFTTESAIAFSYLFVICNSSQGVFIFVTQCLMDEEVKKALKQILKRGEVNNSSVSPSAPSGTDRQVSTRASAVELAT
ncbi:adhesion G-protein coupled receptor D1-like [Amphiura filiformis]|uniref:adhesion G-protein coupled receptor D1-like n=1 Tax=Amphiura filiformis TaxID=82378 RepID=UPI003B214F8B